MRTPALATVYLDNSPVGLMGDPAPRVSKVVAASGKHPDSVLVWRARSADDVRGKPVRLEDTIDRTAEPTIPIYLTSVPKSASTTSTGRSVASAPLPDADATARPPRGPLPPAEQGDGTWAP